MLTSGQIRAARALLSWRQEDLAKHSRVGKATIARIEQTEGMAPGNVSTIVKLQSALEKHGIEFLNDPAGVGVKIRARAKARRKPNFGAGV